MFEASISSNPSPHQLPGVCTVGFADRPMHAYILVLAAARRGLGKLVHGRQARGAMIPARQVKSGAPA